MSWRRRVSLMYAGKVGSDSTYRYPISTEAKGLEAIHYEWDFTFRALRLASTTLSAVPNFANFRSNVYNFAPPSTEARCKASAKSIPRA